MEEGKKSWKEKLRKQMRSQGTVKEWGRGWAKREIKGGNLG